MNNTKHIIFGTGPLGLWIMHILAEKGKHVILVNRSGTITHKLPEHVQIAAGDATDAAVVHRLCNGADVVFHCAMPPYTAWPEKFPPLTKGILEGISHTGSKLIYGDNLYMYGDTKGKPLSENLPYAATGRKGRVRAHMAEMLLKAHERGDIHVAIGRGSDFYGPHVVNAALGEMFFRAALSEKPVNLLGSIDLPHTYTYIKDFARALVTLSERENALGQVWHVPNASTLTTRQLVEIVEKKIGRPIQVRTAGRFLVTALGLVHPMLKEMKEMMYAWEQPYIVDHQKFERAFGAEVTPYEIALKDTVVWYCQRMGLR